MVGLLYCDVVMGVDRPCGNPSVTWLCFEGADKPAESFLLTPECEEFQLKQPSH